METKEMIVKVTNTITTEKRENKSQHYEWENEIVWKHWSK